MENVFDRNTMVMGMSEEANENGSHYGTDYDTMPSGFLTERHTIDLVHNSFIEQHEKKASNFRFSITERQHKKNTHEQIQEEVENKRFFDSTWYVLEHDVHSRRRRSPSPNKQKEKRKPYTYITHTFFTERTNFFRFFCLRSEDTDTKKKYPVEEQDEFSDASQHLIKIQEFHQDKIKI